MWHFLVTLAGWHSCETESDGVDCVGLEIKKHIERFKRMLFFSFDNTGQDSHFLVMSSLSGYKHDKNKQQ